MEESLIQTWCQHPWRNELNVPGRNVDVKKEAVSSLVSVKNKCEKFRYGAEAPALIGQPFWVGVYSHMGVGPSINQIL